MRLKHPKELEYRPIQLRRRDAVFSTALSSDLHPLLRRIYAQRDVRSDRELERSVKYLYPWQSLNGIYQAVELLYEALREGRTIMIVGDFDADGATSTTLAVLALRSMGANVHYSVPNRFEDGYGLSQAMVDQAIARGADFIITVDNGISSHAGVAYAAQKGVPVLVTDHHLPGETLPTAAAIVNPNLSTCHFPSKALAGVGVAFYLMVALRAYLTEKGWFDEKRPVPNLAEFLDLVALGTVADVVPLDVNNRILVWQGLSRIRAGKCRLGIKALLNIAKRHNEYLTASDLGFFLAPRLNAAGRLDDMSVGVELLLTNDWNEAQKIAQDLHDLNQTRKDIEQSMQAEALMLCIQLERQHDNFPPGLSFYHPEWHQGVVGILASRLKERFYRPVIAFAPAGDGTLKGSGRSIAGIHLRDILERVDALNPGLILKFGGHAMAAGLSIRENKFEQFRESFCDTLGKYLDPNSLQNVIWSDGELRLPELNIETAKILHDAGPWGQAFPEPLFDGKFRLIQQKLVGDCHLKVMVETLDGGALLDGIAFNIDREYWPDKNVHQVELVYRLDINRYNGAENVQLLIEHIWPVV